MRDKDRIISSQPPVPWVWFTLLTMMLLFAQHQYQLGRTATTGWTADEFIAIDSLGSTKRQIVYPILGAMGILALWKYRSSRTRLHYVIAIVFFSMLIWATASVFWSIDLPVSVRRLVVYFFLVLGAAGAASRLSWNNALRLLVFCGGALLLYGIAKELSAGVFSPFDPTYRFAGTLHPNEQGQACTLLVLSCMAAAQSMPRFGTAARLMGFLALAMLLLTKSRTSLAAFLAAAAIYVLIVFSGRKKIRVFAAIVLLILVSTLMAEEIAGNWFPQALLLGRADSAEGFNGRIPLWKECLDFARSRPITGYGFEAFWTPEHIDYLSNATGWGIRSAHSAYLELLLNLGIVGLAMHLFFLLAVLFLSVKRFQTSGARLFALAASTVTGYLVIGVLESTILFKDTTFTFLSLVLFFSVGYAPRKFPARRKPRNADYRELDNSTEGGTLPFARSAPNHECSTKRDE